MKNASIFFSALALGLIMILMGFLIVFDSGYRSGKSEVIEIIREEERICRDVNIAVGSLPAYRDCSIYGNLRRKAKD